MATHAPTRSQGRRATRRPPGRRAAKDAPRTIRELRLARAGKEPAPAALDNPLREGLRLERVPDPAALVLFGATGDLSHRKVFPALSQLWRTNLLPHEFGLVAVGRRPYDDDDVPGRDRAVAREVLAGAGRTEAEGGVPRPRSRTTAATSATPPRSTGWRSASRRSTWSTGRASNLLFYLATQPSAFPRSSPSSGGAGSTTRITTAAGAGSSSRSRSGATSSPRSG